MTADTTTSETTADRGLNVVQDPPEDWVEVTYTGPVGHPLALPDGQVITRGTPTTRVAPDLALRLAANTDFDVDIDAPPEAPAKSAAKADHVAWLLTVAPDTPTNDDGNPVDDDGRVLTTEQVIEAYTDPSAGTAGDTDKD